LLEAIVSLSEFITTALLRFDALFADIFTATFGLAIASSMRSKVVVFFEVTEIIFFLWFPDRSTPGWPCRASSAGVAAMAVDEASTIALGRSTRSWSA
jgi:hypothetical protein